MDSPRNHFAVSAALKRILEKTKNFPNEKTYSIYCLLNK